MSQPSLAATDRARPFAPHHEPRATGRGDDRRSPADATDRLFTGVMDRARGALGWMCSGRRHATATATATVGHGHDTREIEVLIARAREVADGRAAVAFGDAGPLVGCPDCGALVGRAKYCPECGRGVALVRSCRMCEADLPASSRFCLECGAQD